MNETSKQKGEPIRVSLISYSYSALFATSQNIGRTGGVGWDKPQGNMHKVAARLGYKR